MITNENKNNMALNYDDYNTKSYEDAITKSLKHFKSNIGSNFQYTQWCKLIKVILDHEATYTKGFKPSPEQYRALLTLAKRTLVDACPGSGKTATLIFKIFLDSAIFKYNLDNQLAITYTNAAAEEMKVRYKQICNRYNTVPVANICTIHSFAKSVETALTSMDVLDPGGMEVVVRNESDSDDDSFDMFGGEFDDMEVLSSWDDEDDTETVYISDRNFISDAIDKLDLPFTYINNINNIEGWISTIIEKDIQTQQEFNQIVEFSSLEDIFLEDLINIHRLTKEFRRSYNVMNFSDMLVGLHDRLVKTEKLDDIDNKIIKNMLTLNVIYVDEYQDISPLQFKIIKELLRLNPNARLFAVGDADQAIYSFRGAYTGFLVYFKDFFTERVDWREHLYGDQKIHQNKDMKAHGFGDIDNLNELSWGDAEETTPKYNKPGADKYKTGTSTDISNKFMQSYIEKAAEESNLELIDGKLVSKEDIEAKKEALWDDSGEDGDILVGSDDIDIIYFTINRRCGKEVIDLANDLIVRNNLRYPKTMKTFGDKHSEVNVEIIKTDKEYRQLILDNILAREITVGKDMSNIAIIYREHRQGIELAVDLIKNNVPLAIKQGILPFNYKETADIINIMTMIMDSKNIINIERNLYKVASSVNKNKAKFIADNMRKYPGTPFSKYLPNTANAQRDLGNLRRCYTDLSGDNMNRAIDTIAESYIKHYLAFFSKTLYKADAAIYYLKSIGAENYLDLMQKHSIIRDNMLKYGNSTHGIQFSTMHSVKGLEFDEVFILPIGDSTMRKSSIISKMEQINENYVKEYEEEERRLLYVAITRAKDKLTLMLENKKDLFCRDIMSYITRTKSLV